MNRSLLISALLATLALAACDVNVPATAPGPAGPQGEAGSPGATGSQGETGYQGTEGAQGATGSQGTEGAQGETGQSGDGTTVIVVPVEPAPAN